MLSGNEQEIDYGLVSIIMPSYNTGKYIAESIESVLNQTYKKWELIIVDDNSTDNTDEIVRRYSDERIIYIKNKENHGAAYSRNLALRKARGKWIAFLDSDDLWEPEKLNHQLAFMLKHNYHFSCTKRGFINEKSERLNKVASSPKKVTKLGMYCYCWPGCLTVIYDSELTGLIQVNETLKKNNDYAMWLKVIKYCDCYYLDEILAYYRVREGSISHDSIRKLIMSHYKLFRNGEKKSVIVSLFLTIINCICGVWKKIFYVKKMD